MSKAQQIYSPSEDEKKRAVPVGFCYSCDQVIGIIQTGFLYNPAVGQVVKNACLESMLIHVPGRSGGEKEKGRERHDVQNGEGIYEPVIHVPVIGGMPQNPPQKERRRKMKTVKIAAE